ncbi:MAG: Na+:solute symporter [Gammaproteobacteria bacterium]|nr:Na+:solute symporter [Gammaproteobacteria bacterium]
MVLAWYDWVIIAAFLIASLAIGFVLRRRAGRDSGSFFLSGRNVPWWLLGISMVATTFSTDTPNLVTEIVRTRGVAGNWVWWAFLITGMFTCFLYARLWRRSGVFTDLEFYELRYSGKPAAAVRAFRAVYLGVFFNVVVISLVTLAAIKIAAVTLGASPLQTVLVAGAVTVAFSALGGFLGVVITDLILFAVSMAGAVAAAWVAVNLPEVGGLANLLESPEVAPRLSFFPDLSNMELAVTLLIIPLAVQWWSVWYPGSEPGGGGYVAQRMLAARTERNATGAVLLFQAAHYAIRPWPWILVALASLVVFPDLDAIREAFPHIEASVIGHDLAYPAMLTFLPHGLLGLVLASLVSAYMSTVSTQLNWGASYVVNDFYRRFVAPEADERTLVLVGRLTTVLLMVLAGWLALYLESALQAFNVLLTIGAGTGLLFFLRWFWWRISAFSEIAAMAVSFVAALYFQFAELPGWTSWQRLVGGVAVTTVGWVLATYLCPRTDPAVLRRFYRRIRPGGGGGGAGPPNPPKNAPPPPGGGPKK